MDIPGAAKPRPANTEKSSKKCFILIIFLKIINFFTTKVFLLHGKTYGGQLKLIQKFLHNDQFFMLLKISYFMDKPRAANKKVLKNFYSNQFFHTTKNFKKIFSRTNL